jgi:hypothetical protein
MVQISAVVVAGQANVEIKPAPMLRCAMAEQLALWIRDDAAPLLSKLGTKLVAIENYDAYECRGRNRVFGAMISEHGKGNAIDVRSFTLADKRVIGPTDMTAPKDVREALRTSACARFTTVLGPGSDGYHEAHIHLDLAERHNGYRICHWAVREPPPPPPPPKPPELPKPAEVANVPAAGKPDAAAAPAYVLPAEPPAADDDAGPQLAEVAMPLPTPRPSRAGKIRRVKRNTNRSFHLPFTLWR